MPWEKALLKPAKSPNIWVDISKTSCVFSLVVLTSSFLASLKFSSPNSVNRFLYSESLSSKSAIIWVDSFEPSLCFLNASSSVTRLSYWIFAMATAPSCLICQRFASCFFVASSTDFWLSPNKSSSFLKRSFSKDSSSLFLVCSALTFASTWAWYSAKSNLLILSTSFCVLLLRSISLLE